MLSPRTCYHAAQEAFDRAPNAAAREGCLSWIGELVWREFNYQVLTRYPHIVRANHKRVYDDIAWENDGELLARWQAGQTGYPVVDAAMRQLAHTGWMHNRARMITASFLCKDLLIDWREGEAHFMRGLLDGDVANNVGGWQWTAGTGTDAAPYFRIFNPTTQGEKFDPTGAYIRRWLPELAALPDKYIHAPHTMPRAEADKYGVKPGENYPLPIVDHAEQRKRALAMYGAASGG
jgi:deoxyribodipyrimidine photo-lyase